MNKVARLSAEDNVEEANTSAEEANVDGLFNTQDELLNATFASTSSEDDSDDDAGSLGSVPPPNSPAPQDEPVQPAAVQHAEEMPDGPGLDESYQALYQATAPYINQTSAGNQAQSNQSQGQAHNQGQNHSSGWTPINNSAQQGNAMGSNTYPAANVSYYGGAWPDGSPHPQHAAFMGGFYPSSAVYADTSQTGYQYPNPDDISNWNALQLQNNLSVQGY